MRCFGAFCLPGYVTIIAQYFERPAFWSLIVLVYVMPSTDGVKGLRADPAMSSNSRPLQFDVGTYTASSQRKKRTARSQSLGRFVTHKAERQADSITVVYRALRHGETPSRLRQVIPDKKDSTILSLHMFP